MSKLNYKYHLHPQSSWFSRSCVSKTQVFTYKSKKIFFFLPSVVSSCTKAFGLQPIKDIRLLQRKQRECSPKAPKTLTGAPFWPSYCLTSTRNNNVFVYLCSVPCNTLSALGMITVKYSEWFIGKLLKTNGASLSPPRGQNSNCSEISKARRHQIHGDVCSTVQRQCTCMCVCVCVCVYEHVYVCVFVCVMWLLNPAR